MPHRPWPRLEPRRRTVETEDGVPLAVEAHGPEQPAGTVVLLHGYELSQRLWARQVAALRTHRPELGVVTYDHRGHGRSGATPPQRATLHQLGRDLHRVLDTLPAGPVVLAGHSMGGMTIMALAEQQPELLGRRVVGAALLGTSAGRLAENTYGVHPALAAVAHRAVPVLQGWVHRRVERGGRKPPQPGTRWLLFGARPDPLDVRRTQQVLDATPAATAAHFYPTFADHDREHALGHLARVPVLVACGDRDRLTPLAHSHALARALPHAELVVYPGSGHMLILERAEDLSGRLTSMVATALPPAVRRAG